MFADRVAAAFDPLDPLNPSTIPDTCHYSQTLRFSYPFRRCLSNASSLLLHQKIDGNASKPCRIPCYPSVNAEPARPLSPVVPVDSGNIAQD